MQLLLLAPPNASAPVAAPASKFRVGVRGKVGESGMGGTTQRRMVGMGACETGTRRYSIASVLFQRVGFAEMAALDGCRDGCRLLCRRLYMAVNGCAWLYMAVHSSRWI